MKSDKNKPNPMKFNFIILLITIGLPSIHLNAQSNKSIIPIVTDTTIKKQSINTFSLILEVGTSNIFNSLGTVYRDDDIVYSDGRYERVKNLNQISIDGNLSYSFGISINHRFGALSKSIFGKSSKSFLLLKHELFFNNLSFIIMNNQNIPKGARTANNYMSAYNNMSLNIQMYNYTPSIDITKNMGGKTNFILNFGPQILVLNPPNKIYSFKDVTEMKFAFGGQLAIGIGYKKSSFRLKYQNFSIAPPNPFSLGTNLKILNNTYPNARFESLNLSTEITF
jgi:hypothetical protein